MVCGFVEDLGERALLDDRAVVHEDDGIGASRAKPISWVTTIIVMPRGELSHHVEHLADQLGIERRGRLVEQHHLRLHRQRARDRHPLLLPTRELGRVGIHLAEAHALQQLVGLLAATALALGFRSVTGRLDDVLERRQVAEEVEALEDDADGHGAAGRPLPVTRTACRPRGGSRRVGRPQQLAALSTFSKWLMQRKKVDLPEPDGPSRQNTSPGWT